MSDPTQSETIVVGADGTEHTYEMYFGSHVPKGCVMCIPDDQPTPPGWKRLSARMYALSDDMAIEAAMRFIVKE